MKIHEYQAKELLAAAGANTPKHVVVKTPEEAEAAFDGVSGGKGVMVKAQVHAGGRGAGQLAGYDGKLGGVKFAPTKEKAKAQYGGIPVPSGASVILPRADGSIDSTLENWPLRGSGARSRP